MTRQKEEGRFFGGDHSQQQQQQSQQQQAAALSARPPLRRAAPHRRVFDCLASTNGALSVTKDFLCRTSPRRVPDRGPRPSPRFRTPKVARRNVNNTGSSM
ncbi:Hypothetical predicted protein [Cloeon dipterum]|uniref:Uncharacterized protein n=1 Tax=Cloeon dipterum TaxID=197152 RepID=A0A8S1DA38_9INSE|nr:Hypothetical predicted protein [Cloeon dipterum]